MQKSLDQRRDQIFDVIVRSYIETAEPVGSRAISRRHGLDLSSASIRNVMVDLEEMGYLKQPHTSAGRVPTDKGYRYWVDRLMAREEMPEKEKDWVRKQLAGARTLSTLKEKVSKIITELTENASMVYFKNMKRVSFLNQLREEMETRKLMDRVEDDSELFIEGIARIFEQPEFQDLRKIRILLHAFDDKYDLIQLLLKNLQEQGVQVHIGHEAAFRDLEDVSVVAKDCYVQRIAIGSIAVVGPTRMKYSKIVSVVEFVADSVTRELERF